MCRYGAFFSFLLCDTRSFLLLRQIHNLFFNQYGVPRRVLSFNMVTGHFYFLFFNMHNSFRVKYDHFKALI